FEPTPERWSAGLEYGTHQLFRRPAPPAALTPFPWVRLKLYSRSVANLTWKYVPFRYLDYDPALVTQGVEYDWSQVSDGLTHNIWKVKSKLEGWYFYDLQVRVEEPSTSATDDGDVYIRMTDDTNELDHIRASADWFRDATFPSGN